MHTNVLFRLHLFRNAYKNIINSISIILYFFISGTISFQDVRTQTLHRNVSITWFSLRLECHYLRLIENMTIFIHHLAYHSDISCLLVTALQLSQSTLVQTCTDYLQNPTAVVTIEKSSSAKKK